ncbi:hypothetical protein L9F63_027243, partial [Diploptera punctata]
VVSKPHIIILFPAVCVTEFMMFEHNTHHSGNEFSQLKLIVQQYKTPYPFYVKLNRFSPLSAIHCLLKCEI